MEHISSLLLIRVFYSAPSSGVSFAMSTVEGIVWSTEDGGNVLKR